MIEKNQTREIRRQIRSVLLREWDPIGVQDIPEAADEYDSYIGGVFDLLQQNASVAELAAYLRQVELRRMELAVPEKYRNAAALALKDLSMKTIMRAGEAIPPI